MNVKTALPKTAETIELLKRWMVDASEMPRAPGMPENGQPGSAGSGPVRHRGGPNGVDVDVTELAQDTEAELRSRSVWWVMGTSLVFEASVLAIAAFIFCRRDF
jgi:hypothetical protein